MPSALLIVKLGAPFRICAGTDIESLPTQGDRTNACATADCARTSARSPLTDAITAFNPTKRTKGKTIIRTRPLRMASAQTGQNSGRSGLQR